MRSDGVDAHAALRAIAARNGAIAPFYVMEVMKAADALERQGRELVHLSVGEPDFTAPPLVRAAAARAIEAGRTQYTHAAGLDALRARIAGWYAERFGVTVEPERVFVTAGASGALLLACALLVEAGSEVLLPDPCYPCNRHFVAAADGIARLVPCGADVRFQLHADAAAAAWGPATRGVLLASPSNPTGTSLRLSDWQALIDAVALARGGFVIADEIYLGLSYDPAYGRSVLELPAAHEHVVTINSFSKYFHMTGWRLGWAVVPKPLVPAMEKLAQNLFICPSSVAQHAALACFEPASLAEYEARRAEFRARRDFIVPALARLGLPVPVEPDGAFYAYLDCSAHAGDSWDFAFELMREAGVVLVPGRDFGRAAPARYLRLSYANTRARLQEAVARIEAHLARRGSPR
jgi:aspartate/methionine/tyrosine aminotransferase